jgi:hypothetical protein
MRLKPLDQPTWREVSVSSKCFGPPRVERHPGCVELLLPNLLSAPGVYADDILITLDGTGRILIPLQIVLYSSVSVLTPSVCFSHVSRADVVYANVRMAFETREDLWRSFDLLMPSEFQQAFLITDAALPGTQVTLTVRIDGPHLGASGVKFVPGQILGPGLDERVFVSFYGQLH